MRARRSPDPSLETAGVAAQAWRRRSALARAAESHRRRQRSWHAHRSDPHGTTAHGFGAAAAAAVAHVERHAEQRRPRQQPAEQCDAHDPNPQANPEPIPQATPDLEPGPDPGPRPQP